MDPGLIREYFSPQIQDIDDALDAYFKERRDPESHVAMIRYHFGFSDSGEKLSSGKRMRPIFCLLVGAATGAGKEPLRALMLATELSHGASLVHDDVQDQDAMRWGRPTVWARFGSGQAINVGDAMIGMTYELLLRLADAGVAPSTVLRVVRIFNAAHLRMSEGQHLDLRNERALDTPIATYLDTISRKTATACESPCRAAAVLAGRSRESEEAFARFGHAFGMLYQIVDDIAGIWGSASATGKLELADICLRKASLPMLYGFLHGSRELRETMSGGTRERPACLSADRAKWIRAELTRLGVPALCRAHAAHHYDEAIASLRATGSNAPEIGMLETMTTLCMRMVDTRPVSRTSSAPPPAC